MTKQIEDEFNLPRLEDVLKEQGENPVEQTPVDQPLAEDNAEVQNVANALQNVNPSDLAKTDPTGTDEHEAEADDVIAEALRSYKELMDLGFNIESKHAGANAFAPAAKFLEIALKASQSKATKKMERIKAIMDKEAHDKEMGNADEGIIEGEGSFMAFRKDMIEKIRKGEI